MLGRYASQDVVQPWANGTSSQSTAFFSPIAPGFSPGRIARFEHIDKILRGVKPVGATELRLVINLKSTNALGLTLPPSLISRADE